MVAIITNHLSRPTRNGQTVAREIICGKNEKQCVTKAQDYIFERVSNTSFIPVEYFEIEIRRANRKDSKVIFLWTYKPTYRA